MIITIYNIKESWIFTNENKPSLQLFNQILLNSQISKCTPSFIEFPSSFNVKIRISDANVFMYNWNLIQLNDDVYYRVNNVEIVQEKHNNSGTVINIEAEIDLYLSYVIKLFDETANIQTPIFFKQKHLNRYFYNDSDVGPSYMINFSKQFYLKNLHQNLDDAGKNLKKYVDVVNNSWYSKNDGANNYNYSSKASINYNNNEAFIYALWKMSAQETSQNQNYGSIFWNGLVNVWGWGGLNNSISWWELLINTASDAYSDLLVLPVAIEYATIPNNINMLFSSIQHFAPNTFTNSDLVVIPANPGIFYFIMNNPTSLNGATAFSFVFDTDPYILNYCKFRCRGAGEDAFTDLTFFDWMTPTTFINTLYSFSLNLNHPTTQITNIPPNANVDENFFMKPWGYNNISDVFFVLNWKAIFPSMSNNWTNYLVNNLNQYHTALNVAHFGLQQAQANIAFAAINGIGSAVGSFFDGDFGAMGASIAGIASGLTNASFNEMSQQVQYNYLKTGKKKDMTRISNERLATNNNVLSYNNYLLTFIFESPVAYEQNMIANYCILNGYVLDRWEPFSFWYNRKYCNYIKCCYFADCLLPNLIVSYKKSIDEMMNGGIRVWSNAAYNQLTPTLNINFVLLGTSFENIGGYTNAELNENNKEINFLNNE